MPGIAPIAVFIVAALALNISPGPDMLYVISRSLEQGRKAGIISALGIGAGTLMHTFVTAIGLSAILLSVPIAFEFVRYAGAAYLVYLGLRMLLERNSGKATTEYSSSKSVRSLRSIFQQGVTTNVLNPKVALFFLAFLPQFVDQSKGTVAFQIILLGLLFDTSGTSVNVIVATLAGHVSDSLRKRSGFARFQKLLPASILIALGLLVALR
ncbi:MAG: LysE family translocator [Candidatus Bathyarchaeia archaeon]|jgi:threonine/homoserine/homoserine lactone efflux protein